MIVKGFCFKRVIFLIVLLFFSIFHAQKKMTIVLDAGHGGDDHGTNRSYTSAGYLAEKDITLKVTLLVGNMLEKNNDIKVIYTRKTDVYPSLTERTNLANRSKADLFVSIHVNGVKRTEAYGTETFVQGPDQNDRNLEIAKRENDVIFMDEQDKRTFGTYDPKSPESLIALRIQQSKYLEKSLILGGLVEENFVKDNRFSRGVKQANLHVLRENAMPSVLVEMGFVSNPDEALYISSSKGQSQIAESIYNAIIKYKNIVTRKGSNADSKKEVEKPKENPLTNDFRVLLMSTNRKYDEGDPAFRGLKYILTIKEKGLYKYYYAVTNYASVRDINLKTAKDAGFKNAYAVGFVPNLKLSTNVGYYTIELAATSTKLSNDSPIVKNLKDVEREKDHGIFYYTYGKVQSLEDAVKLQKDLEDKGIKGTVIQKVLK